MDTRGQPPLQEPLPPYDPAQVPWLDELRQAYRNRRLDQEMTCPHRGAPLAGLQPDADGNVTCPLHRLRWNLKTGRMAPKLAPR